MKAGTHTLDCISFGVPFRLTAESDALLAKLRACTPFGTETCVAQAMEPRDFAVVGDHCTPIYRLLAGGEIAGESTDLHTMLQQLARDVMVYVADNAPDRVFLHAGVVGWRDRALVLPGVSFTGKTTLVAELVRAGATYYSDEYAVIDERGEVHPYARELQMRNAGRVEQRAVSVMQLNGTAGDRPVPVSHVMFVEYVEAGHWRPEPISRGNAVLEMMRHAIAVQRSPARVMAALAKMMKTAEAVRSERGEASETACCLLASMTEDGPSV